MVAQRVRARFDPSGHQIVNVAVRRGYRPNSIRARAGIPLRIVFRREDDDACTERVVFSTPRLDRRLAAAGETTIDLPAQPPGEIRFTCGMGRYRGHIELVDEHRAPLLAGLRDRANRFEAPLGRALVLWLTSLPLIGLFVVPAFGVPAAIVAAGAALVGCVAGGLWASRASAHRA